MLLEEYLSVHLSILRGVVSNVWYETIKYKRIDTQKYSKENTRHWSRLLFSTNRSPVNRETFVKWTVIGGSLDSNSAMFLGFQNGNNYTEITLRVNETTSGSSGHQPSKRRACVCARARVCCAVEVLLSVKAAASATAEEEWVTRTSISALRTALAH